MKKFLSKKSHSPTRINKSSEPVLILELKGHIPSKKNAWKRSARGVYIDKDLKRELDGLLIQLIAIRNRHRLQKPLEGRIRVEACFYDDRVIASIYVDGEAHRAHRSDLDNSYTTFQDLLQSAGIIKNDKMVEEFIVTRI